MYVPNFLWKETAITEEQKAEFIDSLSAKIKEAAASDLLDSIKEDVRKQVKIDRFEWVSDKISKIFTRTIDRLRGAIEDQYKRGTINLAIGIIITIIGLAVLGYYVSELKIDPANPINTAQVFFPRLSLVILIEVFAFFFLKLYRASLIDVKYFQNELTRFEAKYIALWAAYQEEDRAMFEKILEILARTERNVILEKGQSTIDLERERSEKETMFKVIDSLSGAASGITKKVKK